MAEGFFSAQEWARKEPLYLGTAFEASFQRFIAYPLTDLEFILTQLAVSTVFLTYTHKLASHPPPSIKQFLLHNSPSPSCLKRGIFEL